MSGRGSFDYSTNTGFKLDTHEFFAILQFQTILANTVVIFWTDPVFCKTPTRFVFLAFKGLPASDAFFVQLHPRYDSINK
jgi:hypothetical protein